MKNDVIPWWLPFVLPLMVAWEWIKAPFRWIQNLLRRNLMAKVNIKAHPLLASAPPQHAEALTQAVASCPAKVQGPILDILQQLKDLFAKAGSIPWSGLIALVPLIYAAISNPVTGIGPLVLAIAALFNPAT